MPSHPVLQYVLTLQVMFAGGTIANVWLNKVGDLERISLDKYLVGRLLEFVTDVQFTSRRIFVTYLESRVTFVHFDRPIDFADAAYEAEMLKDHDFRSFYI